MKELIGFDINPATGMMNVIGHSGYTFDFAIADLIDNCISANATEILVCFDLNSDNPFLYIKDNGNGMTLEKMKEAAVIGFKDVYETRDENDLGRYSTGLKSATRSFCDSIIISSKVKNQSANAIKIDYQYIIQSKQRKAFIIKDFKEENKIIDSGTTIYCYGLNFIRKDTILNDTYDKIHNLEKSLSHIFGKYLLSKKINIKIRVVGSKDIEIKGWNPFGLVEDKTTKIVYNEVKKYRNSEISIKAYVLPVFDNLNKIDQEYMLGKGLIEQSGFYIYRNSRLIKEGGWLNLEGIKIDDKSKYARIEVNIKNDLDKVFDINFSKNKIVVPDDLKLLFLEVAKKARNESRNSYNYKKHPELRKKLKKDFVSIRKVSKSDSGMVLSVNLEHPVIKELSKEVSPSSLKNLLNLIAKSLPINMIQSQETTVISYSNNEIKELLKQTYESLKNDNVPLQEIKVRLFRIEPFKDYLDILFEFFEKIEEEN